MSILYLDENNASLWLVNELMVTEAGTHLFYLVEEMFVCWDVTIAILIRHVAEPQACLKIGSCIVVSRGTLNQKRKDTHYVTVTIIL